MAKVSDNDWLWALPHIKEALAWDDNRFTPEFIRQRIENSLAQIWFGHNCVAVTETRNTSAGMEIFLWIVGGELQGLLDLERYVTTKAKDEMGCISARVEGRSGWTRAMAPLGYRQVSVTLARKL